MHNIKGQLKKKKNSSQRTSSVLFSSDQWLEALNNTRQRSHGHSQHRWQRLRYKAPPSLWKALTIYISARKGREQPLRERLCPWKRRLQGPENGLSFCGEGVTFSGDTAGPVFTFPVAKKRQTHNYEWSLIRIAFISKQTNNAAEEAFRMRG